MTWNLAYQTSLPNLGPSLTFPISHTFTDSLLIIEASYTRSNRSWNEAGWIYPVFDVENIGGVKGIRKQVYFERRSFRFDNLLGANYQLEFTINNWIPNLNLKIWESDVPLYPITVDQFSGLAATSYTTATVTVTNTVTKLLAANSFRKSATFYNSDSSKTVYLDLVNTVTSTTAAFIIPPGNVYVSDIPWTGDVWAVVKTGSVSVVVREFT